MYILLSSQLNSIWQASPRLYSSSEESEPYKIIEDIKGWEFALRLVPAIVHTCDDESKELNLTIAEKTKN